MRTIIPALILSLCGFILLVSVMQDDHRTQQSHKMRVNSELDDKQSILQADITLTKQLYRLQSRKLMQQMLEDNTDETMVQAMQDLHKLHPHIMQLTWIQSAQKFDGAVNVGHIPERLQHKSQQMLKETWHLLKNQQYSQIVQSKAMHDGEEEYFVIGVSQGQQGPYLLSFMHQHLIEQVRTEQRKNLRIVPYPSDKRMNIKSIDADTLDPVKVRHAEDNEGTSHYYVQQVVVGFKNDLNAQQIAQIKEDIRASHVHKLGYTYVFESEAMTTEQMIHYFSQWDISYVEPHFMYMTNESFVPNDVLYHRYQWNLPMIDSDAGWRLDVDDEGPVVAVIDTGVDLNHIDLNGRLTEGYNTLDPTKAPYDDVGHGTHVSGIICALINNAEGVAGMSLYNKVMPIKALDHSGAGSTYAVAQGIIWATDQGAKVINLSLGNYIPSEFLHDAIKYAYDRDVVIVSAAGNDDTEDPGYPAAYPEVLAVSATNAAQRIATFSNFGSYIDVAAPGENIASTYPDDAYVAMSGTSMASPHVAALAALIRTVNPALSNVNVMDIIRDSAIDLGASGYDNYYGHGQIDVAQALQMTMHPELQLAADNNKEPSIIQQLLNGLLSWLTP